MARESGNAELVTVKRSTDLVAINELEEALLSGIAPMEVEQDPEEVSREIVAALLAAESDEELERLEAESWGPSKGSPTKPPSPGYLGVPFEIHSFVWRPSTFEEGQPVFLVVRALRLDDGSPHVLTIGSAQVMAQLANLAKRGRLPVIRELAGTETKQKRMVYWLKTPEEVARARREAALAEAAASADVA